MRLFVFPARAGMSLQRVARDFAHESFPRASGDEPRPRHADNTLIGFSPRERG